MMHRHLVSLFTALGLSTAGLLSLSAQDVDLRQIVVGEAVTMHSEILGEPRRVMVYKPRGYDQSATRYPVLYLLDGDAHLLHTGGIVDFLSRNGRMPEMLVVGVPNTDRTRDLTPALAGDPPPNFPTAGAADAFLRFLVEELQPFVDTRYRTEPYRVLVGHSFGGLFTVHALTTRPDAFDAHIAISPSLWWDDRAPVGRAEALFEARPDVASTLYLTLGNEQGDMRPAVEAFVDLLEARASDDFRWAYNMLEQEDHGSVPHRSIYAGLEFLYDGWQVPPEILAAGDVTAVDRHFAGLSERFGYDVAAAEALVNQLGYQLLGAGRTDEAIAVFERNVRRFPESANVYDSLGDALDAAGRAEEAETNYTKACAMGRAASDPNAGLFCDNAARMREMKSEE